MCACGWKIGTTDPDFLFAGRTQRRRRSNAGSKSKTDNHQRLGNRSQARLDLSKNLAGSQVKSGGGDRQARGAIPFLLTFSFRIDRSDSSPLGLVTAVLIFQARHFFSSTSRGAAALADPGGLPTSDNTIKTRGWAGSVLVASCLGFQLQKKKDDQGNRQRCSSSSSCSETHAREAPTAAAIGRYCQ